MRRLLISLLTACASTGASAADDRGIQQAVYAFKLFSAACVATYGLQRRVDEWALNSAPAEFSPESAREYLRGKNGRIWLFLGDLGKFHVISQEGGICTVQAERVNAAALRDLYDNFLRDLPRGYKTALLEEGTRATSRGDLYSLVHDSESATTGIILRTLLSTSESESAYNQGLLTLSARRR